MRPNSSVSMYGGAGGRNCRASTSSLKGLRDVLGNGNAADVDSAPASRGAPRRPEAAAAASPAPAEPEDNKQTLQGLNNRLGGYIDTVKELQEGNENLKKEIDDILAKRNVPDGRDWDKVEEAMEPLKQKVGWGIDFSILQGKYK